MTLLQNKIVEGAATTARNKAAERIASIPLPSSPESHEKSSVGAEESQDQQITKEKVSEKVAALRSRLGDDFDPKQKEAEGGKHSGKPNRRRPPPPRGRPVGCRRGLGR